MNNDKSEITEENVLNNNKAVNFDYVKIKLLIDKVKEVKIESVKKDFHSFKVKSIDVFDKRIVRTKATFEEKLNLFKSKMKNKIQTMRDEAKNLDNQVESGGYELPTETFSLEDIKKTFEKLLIKRTNANSILNQAEKDGSQNQFNMTFPNTGKSINEICIKEVESVVGLIKKFSDNEKINKAFKSMESAIYRKYLDEKKDITACLIKDKTQNIISKIKEEMGDLKSNFLQPKPVNSYIFEVNNFFNSNPLKLKTEKLIVEHCQKAYTIDSVFCTFNTNNQKAYLAWSNTQVQHTVGVYDLEKDKPLQILKGHTQHVYVVRHFYDARYTTDYLLSTSYDKKAIVWKYDYDTNKFSLLLSINTGHSGLYIYSGIILFDFLSDKPQQDSSLIITSVPHEQLKVFNFKGTLIKHIGNKADYTYFINSHFDSKKNCFYIINANSTQVKLLDFKDGSTVRSYVDDISTWHMSAFVCDLKDETYLFESDGSGYIRIWFYETAKIWKKMHAPSCSLRGIILWNEKYLIAASSDKAYKIFDLDEGKLDTVKTCHENVLCTVQKIVHPNLGECLITCAIDGKIKLFSA